MPKRRMNRFNGLWFSPKNTYVKPRWVACSMRHNRSLFFGISIFLPILVKGMGIGDASTVNYLYNGAMMVGILLGIVVFNHVSR